MAEEVKPLYSTCVAILGFICFVVGATAVGIPMWGYFDTPSAGPGEERGYFGPWRTCKLLLYNRERCGADSSRFRPTIAVWVAGSVASIGVAVLGVYCLLSVLQLAMLTSKEKVVIKYSAVVMAKLALGLLSALLAISGAGLFALQTDDRRNNGFHISRGPGFYVQILLIVLVIVLFVMSVYDMLYSRRIGGDPTKVHSLPLETAITYGNPGFRDSCTNNNVSGGISMTDASGKPYLSLMVSNGSMISMNTTSTTLASSTANGGSSTMASSTRSPLRSSLKKPRTIRPDGTIGFGIQNPGFSGTSPTLSRNGSVKKVRIQTHSTEV